MAKRKTSKKVKIEEAQKIEYNGKVSIKIQRGNKIFSLRSSHNAGRLPLFKFLCNCLAGIYSEQSRPCKIKLFNCIDNDALIDITKFNWDNEFDKNWMLEVSPYITYDATPAVKENIDTKGNTFWSTTYHFKVNSGYISGSEINVIGIYANSSSDSREDCLAFYKLVKEDNDKEWDPIDLKDVSGDYSIIIEWKMTVSNKA